MVSAIETEERPHKRMAVRGRTGQHSSNRIPAGRVGILIVNLTLVTKSARIRTKLQVLRATLVALLALCCLPPGLHGQGAALTASATLYRALRESGIDTSKVYR